MLSKGMRNHVRNGKSVSVWMDSWIDDDVMIIPLMKNIDKIMTINILWIIIIIGYVCIIKWSYSVKSSYWMIKILKRVDVREAE